MKIRITDLLDDYIDDNLPLDPCPYKQKCSNIRKTEKKRKTRKIWPVHRLAQLTAGLVIVVSLSVIAFFYVNRSPEGGSQKLTMKHVQTEEIPQNIQMTESVAEQSAVATIAEMDSGYEMYSIEVQENGLSVTMDHLVRNGAVYYLMISISSEIENVTGFVVDDATVRLELTGGETIFPASVDSSQDEADPFDQKLDVDFTGLVSEEEMRDAILVIEISSVTVETTGEPVKISGHWSVCLTENVAAQENDISEDLSVITPPAALDEGYNFAISDAEVSGNSCSFWLRTTSSSYTLVPLGQLELASQKMMDTQCYGFGFISSNGVMLDIVFDASNMSTRGITPSEKLVFCTASWRDTVDLDDVVGIYVTDGSRNIVANVSKVY